MMDRQEFDQHQLRISVTAGMNQRFHQDRAAHWSKRNRQVQVAVGGLSVASLCFAVAALAEVGAWAEWTGLAASIFTASVAIFLNVIPLSERARDHTDLFRRWTDLREDIDALQFHSGAPNTAVAQRLRELDFKVHRTCGAEGGLSTADEKRLKTFEAAEKNSRPNCAPM